MMFGTTWRFHCRYCSTFFWLSYASREGCTLGPSSKEFDFTPLACLLSFFIFSTTWYPAIGAQFRAIRAQFKKCTGTTDIYLPNVSIQWLKCLVRPIQVNLMAYLRQRQITMLVVDGPSSVLPSIVWLCQRMLQESLGTWLFEHVGVPNKMKQANEHFLNFCNAFLKMSIFCSWALFSVSKEGSGTAAGIFHQKRQTALLGRAFKQPPRYRKGVWKGQVFGIISLRPTCLSLYGNTFTFHRVTVIAVRTTGKRLVLAPGTARKFTLQTFA